MKRKALLKSTSGVTPKKMCRVELYPEKENLSLSRTVKIRKDDFDIYCAPGQEKAIEHVVPAWINKWSSGELEKAILAHGLFNMIFKDKLHLSAVQVLQKLSRTFPYSRWGLMPAEAREHALRDIIALTNVTTLAVLMVLHKGPDNTVLDLVASEAPPTAREILKCIKRSAKSCLNLSQSNKYLGADRLDSENSRIECKHGDQILQFPTESIQGDLVLRLGAYGACLVSRSLWYETSPLACLSNVALDSCLSPKALIAELTTLATSGWKGLVQEDVTTVPMHGASGEYVRVPNDSIWLMYRHDIDICDI